MNKLILLIVVVFMLVACVPPTSSGLADKNGYFVKDGMPCFEDYSDITCDWSKWQGQVINGEVVVYE